MEPDMTQAILDKTAGKTYLEIGVENGHSFWPIQAKTKIGVDPYLDIKKSKHLRRSFWKAFLGQRELFFKIPSDEFFARHTSSFSGKKIDVALVDGLHTYEQSLRDVLNCLEYLNEGGVIVLDDVNPSTSAMACPAASIVDAHRIKPEGWNGEWCGDAWKTVVYLRAFRKDLSVFVIDAQHGVGIVTRGTPENTLSYSEADIAGMQYSDLEKHRADFLNLKQPDYLRSFLAGL